MKTFEELLKKTKKLRDKTIKEYEHKKMTLEVKNAIKSYNDIIQYINLQIKEKSI